MICQASLDHAAPEVHCRPRCVYAPDNAHVICCNDSVEHVHLGTEQDAKARLEELAKAYFDRNRHYWDQAARYNNHLTDARYPGEPPSYVYYRHQCYWHIHTTGVST